MLSQSQAMLQICMLDLGFNWAWKTENCWESAGSFFFVAGKGDGVKHVKQATSAAVRTFSNHAFEWPGSSQEGC